MEPAPPSSRASSSLPPLSQRSEEHAWTALRNLYPAALFAVVVMVFGRAIAPSVHGLAVGMGSFVDRMEFSGHVAGQLGALVMAMTLVTLVVSLVRMPVAVTLKVLFVSIAGLIVFISAIASASRIPIEMGVLTGAAGAFVALLAASLTVRHAPARWTAIAVGLAGVGTLVRMLSAVAASHAVEANAPAAVTWARALATVAFAADVLILGVAATWLILQNRRLAAPLVLIALALALFTARVALADVDNPSPAVILVIRAASRMLSQPEPFVPYAVDIFVVVWALWTCVTLALGHGGQRALAGVLVLAAVVRSSAEIPLYSLMLASASIGLLLAARVGEPATKPLKT